MGREDIDIQELLVTPVSYSNMTREFPQNTIHVYFITEEKKATEPFGGREGGKRRGMEEGKQNKIVYAQFLICD